MINELVEQIKSTSAASIELWLRIVIFQILNEILVTFWTQAMMAYNKQYAMNLKLHDQFTTKISQHFKYINGSFQNDENNHRL